MNTKKVIATVLALTMVVGSTSEVIPQIKSINNGIVASASVTLTYKDEANGNYVWSDGTFAVRNVKYKPISEKFTKDSTTYDCVECLGGINNATFENGLWIGCATANPKTNKIYAVRSIADNAFKNYTGIPFIYINASYTVKDANGNATSTKLSLGSIEKIGKSAFENCFGSENVSNGTEMGNAEWAGTGLTGTIHIGGNISTIGERSFAGCTQLKKVVFPTTLSTIGTKAFVNCKNLSSNYYIEDNGSTLKLPTNIKIQDGAFYNTKFVHAEIPKGAVVSREAFRNCTSLKSIKFNDEFYGDIDTTTEKRTIPPRFAYGCSALSTVEFSDKCGVTRIGDSSFAKTDLANINLTESLTRIDNRAFAKTSLTSLTIPKSVTQICDYAFCETLKMQTITIPKTVIEIGEKAFGYKYVNSTDDITSTNVTPNNNFLTKYYEKTEGENYVKKNSIRNEAIHEYAWRIITQPTCTTEGVKEKYCIYGEEIAETQKIPATGHKYGNWVTTKEATCMEKGTKQRTCSVCGKKETQEIPATGHKYSEEWTIDKQATCTEEGSQSHHCTKCGDKKDITKIPALGHTFTEWAVTKPATCTEEGEEQRKCSCGETETRKIDATGHKYTEKVVKPTCTKSGYTLHKCSICGESYTDNEVKALGHNYVKKIIKPTCTKSGYTLYKCSRCNKSYTDTVTKALGHKYIKVKVVKPTLKSKGYTLYRCTKCGATVKKNVVPALISVTKAKITGIKNTTYTGKQIKPVIKVVIGKTALKNSRDYSVVYGKNKIGRAVVKIVGKGKYAGSVTKYFRILPRRTAVAVKSTVKGKISVAYVKRSEALKYQIQLSSNSKFIGAKTYTVKSTKTTLRGVSNKIYYIRVRTVYGNYVSGWSAVKKVRVKATTKPSKPSKPSNTKPTAGSGSSTIIFRF